MLKRMSRLTPRQLEVLSLVAGGMTSRDIAQKLGISKRTVDVHRYLTGKIVGSKNVVQLIRTALRQKLISYAEGQS
jgi:two-component system response regulator FixJ